MKRIIVAFFSVSFLAFSLFFWRANILQKESSAKVDYEIKLQASMIVQQQDRRKKEDDEKALLEKQSQVEKNAIPIQQQTAIMKVPFTSQAPLSNWSDMRFQDGCEEASLAMAFKWTQGETFSSPNEAQQEILNIVAFEEKTFGHYIDSSVEDVGKILSQFYGYKNYSVKKDFNSDNMKQELEAGNILLIPAFGRALGNPNFKAPGPIAHMLVILGFDAKTKEFITNDPGTRKGEGYRYSEKVLFNAIWAYPSSAEHPKVPKSTDAKAMLIVSRG